MDIKNIREKFPYLKTGRIYFNHAAIGPISIYAKKNIDKFLKERGEEEIENYFPFQQVVAETKNLLGELLNCETDRIAFADNVSNALNIPAQGLEWKAGDRVVLFDYEFPSNIYPFLNLKSYGVEIDFIKSENGIYDLEKIERSIKPRTKLLSVSHVQFLSGYKIDLERLGEICEEKGIIFTIDGIQAAGAMRVDVKKMKADFYASGSQKWLMSLQGLSFFYISERLQKLISPKFVGWTSVKNAWNLLDYKLDLRDSADAFQNGTFSAIGVAALNGTLNLMKEFGFEEMQQRIIANSKYLISNLLEVGVNPILSGIDDKNLSGIVSFKIDRAEEIFKELKNRSINAAVREGMIRLSPHFYNNFEEIDEVVKNIRLLLK